MLEIIMISLLVVLIIFVAILTIIVIKKNKSSNIDEIKKQNAELEKNLIDKLYLLNSQTQVKNTSDLKDLTAQINTTMYNFRIQTSEFLDNKMRDLNSSMSNNIQSNFINANNTIKEMIASLSEVKKAQTSLENAQKDIVNLQNLLSDKRTRGNFGEMQLNTILYNIFGEYSSSSCYEIQHVLYSDDDKKVIADALIKCPPPINDICIDSKFPLENYRKMIDNYNIKTEYTHFFYLFESDVKREINEVASKYIIPGVTSSQAIVFLPSEAIFAEINANHINLIDYAQKRNVWLTSPTTLMAFLTTIASLLENIKFTKNLEVIKINLKKLSILFDNYKDRWDKLSKDIEKVHLDTKNISTTTDKITRNFSKIMSSDKVENIE